MAGGAAFMGGTVVGSDARAARFIAPVSAFASSIESTVRTPRNAVSVTSRMIDVSVGLIIRARDIDPADTPGPATTASHRTYVPFLGGLAARTREAESDQRRKSTARSENASDVRSSATPMRTDP